MNTLDATRGSFIRCIKPNAAMAVGVFDNQYVVDQLRCQGIMQTCEVLKAGLPTRVGYDEVLGMVRPHLPQQILNSLNSIATAAAVQNVGAMAVAAVFWAFELEPSSFKLGLTRAFFKTGQLGAMEKVLRVDWAVEGQRICNRVKLWIVRRRWRSACFKVVSQNAFLFILLEGLKRDAATALLQSQWRGFLQKHRFGKQKNAALIFERIARGHFGRLKAAQRAVEFQKELVQKREKKQPASRESVFSRPKLKNGHGLKKKHGSRKRSTAEQRRNYSGERKKEIAFVLKWKGNRSVSERKPKKNVLPTKRNCSEIKKRKLTRTERRQRRKLQH